MLVVLCVRVCCLISIEQQVLHVMPFAHLQLEGISKVDLSKNSFKGTLPESWLKSPSKLEFLNLASNQLTGTIPCKLACNAACTAATA